ncbi:hypothetical protein [Hymenobacter crusticola]|uniref:Uncharacterized protein n=1 Tax=Hymenobacter crusticola TaxID=1770526 RepID=A0A243WC47_9BACT|nr:hypothetical protein [Hymenobacter crusticola]OUJ73181.1 hypothetical protein BXP70_15255 [Hymenobacter crusticola]
MNKSEALGLNFVYANLILNIYGLFTAIAFNVYPKGLPFSLTLGWLFMYYAWAALYLGIPLFIITIWLAPAGTFINRTKAGAIYLRAFLLNQALVMLIWLAPFIYLFLVK